MPPVAPRTPLGLGLPLIVPALDQGVNDPVALSGTWQHRPVESVLNGAWGRPERGSQDEVLPGRSTVLWARDGRTRLARRSLAYCAHLTATHYENFSVVTWLTPGEHRPAFQSIYAFCRWSDDLGDEIGDPAIARASGMVARRAAGHVPGPGAASGHGRAGRDRLELQDSDRPVRACSSTRSCRIRRSRNTRPILNSWTIARDRPTRSVIWCSMWPVRHTAENARLADATCTALQLANFWQDVARDLAIGRIYLPREDREQFGYPESDLKALRFTQAFAELMRFEAERTRGAVRPGSCLGAEDSRCHWPSISTCSRGVAWRYWIGSKPAVSTS